MSWFPNWLPVFSYSSMQNNPFIYNISIYNMICFFYPKDSVILKGIEVYNLTLTSVFLPSVEICRLSFGIDTVTFLPTFSTEIELPSSCLWKECNTYICHK